VHTFFFLGVILYSYGRCTVHAKERSDRLPRSGAVVFTIRTYFHPITSICKEPYVPGRLASAIRSWGDDVSHYKGKAKYGDILLAYLDECHAEQVAKGQVIVNETGEMAEAEEEEERRRHSGKARGYPW
jgi:hypothetical protein